MTALEQARDMMTDCDIDPRPLIYPLTDYHRAGIDGPLHATWQDKPHRLLYDLIAAVRHYSALSAQEVPADLLRLEALADAYAKAASTAHVEGLYGGSKAYAQECMGKANKARSELMRALTAAPAAPKQAEPDYRGALADLVDEFKKVFPIYYYAEPWAHDQNAVLLNAQLLLDAAPAAPRG